MARTGIYEEEKGGFYWVCSKYLEKTPWLNSSPGKFQKTFQGKTMPAICTMMQKCQGPHPGPNHKQTDTEKATAPRPCACGLTHKAEGS